LFRTLNGNLKENANGDIPVNASCVFVKVDSKLIVSSNGVFEMKSNVLVPLLYFDKMKQEVNVDGGKMDFEFKPRCVIAIECLFR
jgi:hypothetical protein